MNELPENSANGTALESLDYLRGVKSSTCLLLPTTPSPTQMDFKHPLSDQMNDVAFLGITEEPNIDTLQGNDALAGDSSSSGDSNSVVQDPVSAQLINNISMLDYQTLSKTGDTVIGESDNVIINGNANATKNKLPKFVNWNWMLIRKVLLWVVLSALIACIGAIIGMVITIPKTCNPDLPWYQGKVFYEVFPASFKDSNNDGTGDLKGLIKNLDYIEELGASAIRLNYIYEAQQYPERYFNTTSVLKIDRSIGTVNDFQDLVTEVHNRNMSIILDLPVTSIISSLKIPNGNSTEALYTNNESVIRDPTSVAISYWARAQKVDGFYLKNLEQFVHEPYFVKSLQTWKQTIGNGKIFIASEEAMVKANGTALDALLSRIDMIDIHIDLKKDVNELKTKIDEVLNGPLWMKPHHPWVHWNVGNINSERVSTRHQNNTLVLTALELMLPGTVSIFYGDEIGLGGLLKHEVETDFHEHKHVHNLVPMAWMNRDNNNAILYWNSKSVLDPRFHYLDVIKRIIKLRLNTPTIYLNSIYKEGSILKNAAVRKTNSSLVIIERWYPRRNTCVFVGNLGGENISTDLTTMFYGGTVVAGTNTSLIGEVIYFDKITFPPYSAIILKLEK